jgi:catechol 2,3-dioxygenase-like lactoylglutathione lyase family enzyme
VTRLQRITPRLPVADLRPAIEFYTNVLGFKLGLLWPEGAPTFAILNRDDASVQFCLADPPGKLPFEQATLCFDVDDVRALHANLDGRIAIEWGPEVYWYGRREFAIRDPAGYMLIFSELTDDPPTCDEGG